MARRLIALPMLLLALAPKAFASELGVNYNGVLSQIDKGDLARCNAKLIRGFVDYYEFESGKKNLKTDDGLKKLHAAHLAGYKTIINIKFNFEKKNLPTTAAAVNSELSYLDTLVGGIYPDCDVLVCGNEPFIESKIDQRDSRLVNFYEAAALKLNVFLSKQTRQIPLYLGAFNNLWKPSWQTPAVVSLLQFASASSWLAGIDLHIHHTELSDIDGAFEYVNPRIRDDQQILVTEFSLKNEWKLHLKDPIPRIMSAKYRRPSGWLVYQYLNYTIHDPVSRAEWVAFLSNSPWFETRKDYLSIAWAKFTGQPKFNLATYGIYQNAPMTFTATTDPWIINPLFVNTTVVRDAKTHLIQTNYSFFDEFRTINP